MNSMISKFSLPLLSLMLLIAYTSTPARAEREQSADTISLTITSDAETWIAILGPQKHAPEKYKKKTYELQPGQYTILGRKKGKQDNKIELKITKGMSPLTIKVLCTKPWKPE